MTDESKSGADTGDGSTGGEDIVERVSADEAFELLGNETRLGIIRALFEAEDTLSFSELRQAVGTRDSGQFNYHLDKLVGAFVQRTDDEYELTAAGTHVVGAVLAGEYTKTIEGDPVEVDTDCRSCGGTLAGFFDEETVRVACTECDRNIMRLNVPPGAFEEYPREEWPFVAERWTRREFETVQAGFCPTCHGPIESQVELLPEELHEMFDVGVEYSCERCGQGIFANVEASVGTHPSVIAFHYNHGIDVEDTPIWELEWAVEANAEVVSEDPLHVEVPIELEGDRLVLVVDEEAEVIEERRE